MTLRLKEFDVILDIKTQKVKYRDPISQKIIKQIAVKKGDYISTQLNFYLEDGGLPYDIGENDVEIIFKKYDKTFVMVDKLSEGFTVVDNVPKVILSTNMTSIVGRRVVGEVIVRGINGEVLISTTNFEFLVISGLLNEVVESVNEIPLLDRLITQVTELDTLLRNNEAGRENTFAIKIQEIDNTYAELIDKVNTADLRLVDIDNKMLEVNTTLSNIITSYNNKILEVDTAKSDLITSVNNKIDEVNETQANLTTSINNKITEVNTLIGNKIIEIDTAMDNKVIEVDGLIGGKIDEINTALSDKITEVNTTVNNKIDDIDIALNSEIDEINTTVNNKMTEVDTSVNNKIDEVNTLIGNVEQAELLREQYKIYVGNTEPAEGYSFWYDSDDSEGITRR